MQNWLSKNYSRHTTKNAKSPPQSRSSHKDMLEMSARYGSMWLDAAQPFGTWKWSPHWRCDWWPLQADFWTTTVELTLHGPWWSMFLRWSSMHEPRQEWGHVGSCCTLFHFVSSKPFQIPAFSFQASCDGLWLGFQTVLDCFCPNYESSWAALNAASRAVLKLVPPISWQTTGCCFLTFWIASKKMRASALGAWTTMVPWVLL